MALQIFIHIHTYFSYVELVKKKKAYSEDFESGGILFGPETSPDLKKINPRTFPFLIVILKVNKTVPECGST